MKECLLTVVIANYNYGKYLEESILSVLDQNVPEVELVVVDGGSTDNSVEIIRKYASRLAWWVSERDKGQSDAFNKGFAHSNGKYLTWLNADDIMPSGCLSKIICELKAHPTCEWFTSNCFRFDQTTKAITFIHWGPHYLPKCLQTKGMPIIAYGPSTIFSKRIYEAVGRIDESYHYAMDSDMWVRFIVRGIKQRRINCFSWAFRMHVESKTADVPGKDPSRHVTDRLKEEHSRTSAREHYQASALIRRLIFILRILDGSLLRWGYLRLKYMGHPYAEIGRMD